MKTEYITPGEIKYIIQDEVDRLEKIRKHRPSFHDKCDSEVAKAALAGQIIQLKTVQALIKAQEESNKAEEHMTLSA